MEPAKEVERPIRMRGRDGRRVGQAGPAIAALALALLLTACTDGATNLPSADGDTDERQAEIYTAALERFLQQAPKRLGHHADILVVSRAVEGGGLSTGGRETRNIARDVQEAISRQVDEVGSLTWVPHSREVLTVRRHRGHVGICSIVPGGDMVVTLDVLDEPGDSASVGVSAYGEEFRPNDCVVGWLKTYVVERTEDGWRVTGSTVPEAVT